MNRELKGFHHITAITSDASEAVRFYTRVLGLRLVKKTVNFDDPSAYHLYFGDENGTPGTILTFFDWGPSINQGSLGKGVTHHLAFTTKNDENLLKWRNHLEQWNVPVEGPFDRETYRSIYLLDPDGLIVEIATPEGIGRVSAGPSELGVFSRKTSDRPPTNLAKPPEQGMQLLGLHHATAIANRTSEPYDFYNDLLKMSGLSKKDRPDSNDNRFSYRIGGGKDFLCFLHSSTAAVGQVGIGTVHHIAMAVDSAVEQQEWREQLLEADVRVTTVLDRKYFKSIYFREPNGVLLEIATIGPGFAVDEAIDQLGQSLALPGWLEPRRQVIEASLRPLEASQY